MKHIRITPPSTAPYEIKIGNIKLPMDSKRLAASEADRISKDLTDILIDINLIYTEYLVHIRRAWVLECPTLPKLTELSTAIEYHLNRASANHTACMPVDNLMKALDHITEGFESMKFFYRTRNQSVLTIEARKSVDQCRTLHHRLIAYKKIKDTFLFL